MRVMVIVKATKNSEAGVMPGEKLLAEMGRYNEELVKAGVMLAGEGLHPSSKGKRVVLSGGKKTMLDGPFAARARHRARGEREAARRPCSTALSRRPGSSSPVSGCGK